MKRNLWYMIAMAWNQRRSVLWFCLAAAMTGILLSLTQLTMVPAILGTLETGASPGKVAAVVLLFAVLLMALNAGREYLASASQFGRIELRLHLAAEIQNKTLTMSYPNIEDQGVRKKRDKATMLVNSNQGASETIWATLVELLKSTGEFLVCLSLLSSLSPSLIALVLVTAVIRFAVSNRLGGWGYRHRDEESEYSRRMNYLSEKSRDYTLAKDVRIFGMGRWMEEVYDGTLRMFRRFAARGERVYLWGDIIDAALTFLRGGVVFFFLLRGEMTAAQFVLYFNAVNVFTGGIGSVMSGFAALYRQSLDIAAIREFLDCPEVFRLEGGIPLSPAMPCTIQLRDVSFRYPGAGKDTLSHLDLTVGPGEKLAIVGLNGAGKTTLIKLLCGFLEPTGGQVLLNGADIRVYNRRDYYRLFSAVFQDFSVLDVTIAENIAQTDEAIDSARMERCIRQAGLTEKINRLPKGVETHLGRVFEDGVSLSGGELQRLMLARALYKDAPVIVLDEPTSALDPIAEREIYRKYSELTAGKTAVYISHRLASTRFCDRILLLSEGRIAETGTHEELLARNGRYAELFAVQSKYYRKIN